MAEGRRSYDSVLSFCRRGLSFGPESASLSSPSLAGPFLPDFFLSAGSLISSGGTSFLPSCDQAACPARMKMVRNAIVARRMAVTSELSQRIRHLSAQTARRTSRFAGRWIRFERYGRDANSPIVVWKGVRRGSRRHNLFVDRELSSLPSCHSLNGKTGISGQWPLPLMAAAVGGRAGAGGAGVL